MSRELGQDEDKEGMGAASQAAGEIYQCSKFCGPGGVHHVTKQTFFTVNAAFTYSHLECVIFVSNFLAG